MEKVSRGIAAVEAHLSTARLLLEKLRESTFDDRIASDLLRQIREEARIGMELTSDIEDEADKLDKPIRGPLIQRAEDLFGDLMQVQSDASIAAGRSITGVNTYKEVSAILRSLRRVAGLQLDDLAEKMDSNKSTLNHYETGRSRPDIAKIAAWADACGYRASVWFRPKSSYNLSARVGIQAASLPQRDQEILLRIAELMVRMQESREHSADLAMVESLLLFLDRKYWGSARNRHLFKDTRWDTPELFYFSWDDSPVLVANEYLEIMFGLTERDGVPHAICMRILLNRVSEHDTRMLIRAMQEDAGSDAGRLRYEGFVQTAYAAGVELDRRHGPPDPEWERLAEERKKLWAAEPEPESETEHKSEPE